MHCYAFGMWEEIKQFAQGEIGSFWQDHVGYVWPRGYVYGFKPHFYTAFLKSPSQNEKYSCIIHIS